MIHQPHFQFGESDAETCPCGTVHTRTLMETPGEPIRKSDHKPPLRLRSAARKPGDALFIEVIGFKDSPPARSKDFFEVFFRVISRLNEGARRLVIALPDGFSRGLHQRASVYGPAWARLGVAFPELEVWLVDHKEPSYRRTTWAEWFPSRSHAPRGNASLDAPRRGGGHDP